VRSETGRKPSDGLQESLLGQHRRVLFLHREETAELVGVFLRMKVVAANVLILLVAACATSTPQLRVGHTTSNGNCAIGADGKLTGLCVGSARSVACVWHAPASESSCPAGAVPTKVRAPACETDAAASVSYDHECSFVAGGD